MWSVVIAGKEYGTGSSRDWAAKGPYLLGVQAVLAESFERIHRSNLVGMGVLPIQFMDGESAEILGLTGHEVFAISGLSRALEGDFSPGMRVEVEARGKDGSAKKFAAVLRIDTQNEVRYYRHGGILPFVLRQLVPA